MTVKQITIGVFASFALLTGCEDAAKMGADAAIKTGEAAIGAVKADAEKYIPGDAKSLTDALAKAKDAFAKQDYAGALAGAKELAEKAKDLGPAAMKAKEQLKEKALKDPEVLSAVGAKQIEKIFSGGTHKVAIAQALKRFLNNLKG